MSVVSGSVKDVARAWGIAPLHVKGEQMNKGSLAVLATAVLALTISGCGGPGSSQTGGGTTGDGASASPAETTQAAVKQLTVADVIAEGWLAGNAKPTLGEGAPGKADVVASGKVIADAMGTTVPIALRNNTEDTISSIEVAGSAVDASGKILASGQSQGLNPAVVPPGGISLGYVYFSSTTKVPANAKMEFTVASQPVEEGTKPYFRDLKVDQANLVGEAITGKATNTSQDTLNGPYAVRVTCFDAKGAMMDSQTTYASPSADIAAGQSVTFQVQFYGKKCPSFLLGVGGYGPLN